MPLRAWRDDTTLWRHARLATLAAATPWGWIERGALLSDGDTHPPGSAPTPRCLPALQADAELDLGGALVTPGLVDCHTHLVYGGHRAREFELRLQGASYEQIARAGGGIRSTVAATRAADDDALFASARQRALTLMREGVTTLEIKSGYGLSAEHEARCLRIARRLGRELPLTVRTTCLAAHALPPEFDGRADDYIDAVCGWLPAAAGRRPGRCGRRLLRAHRLHAGADAAGVRGRARAGPAGQAACRTAQRPRRRGAGRVLRRAVLRPPGMAVAPTACARWPRPARWRCCCPAPSTSCAKPSCRRCRRCATPACRSRWPATTTPARRRACRCC